MKEISRYAQNLSGCVTGYIFPWKADRSHGVQRMQPANNSNNQHVCSLFNGKWNKIVCQVTLPLSKRLCFFLHI